MRWATRRHCHIDRAACAWLIRRYIDQEPEFVFVDDPDDVPEDATAFDLRGADLSHHNGDCSFETFLRRYDLDDPILWDLARIVHEGDLGDERYDAPEAVGIDADRPRPLYGPRRRTSPRADRTRSSTASTSCGSERSRSAENRAERHQRPRLAESLVDGEGGI